MPQLQNKGNFQSEYGKADQQAEMEQKKKLLQDLIKNNPITKATYKALEESTTAHVQEAISAGMPYASIIDSAHQQAGIPKPSTNPEQIAETPQSAKPKGNFWHTPFQINQQTGEVTPESVLGGLFKSTPEDTLLNVKAAQGAQSMQGFDTNKSIEKLSKVNQALKNSGLEDYQATQTAEGNFIIHPKPVGENGMVIGLKEQQQQDRLEKSYADNLNKILSNRSGGLGLQDSKVNQAIHLRSLIDQTYDPKTKTFNIKPTQYEETAIGLANLLSGTNVVTESMRNGIRQRTAEGDFNGALTYMLGMPKNASTQEIFKTLVSSIDRQGLVSEKLRNKYLKDIKQKSPSRLDPERRSRLEESAMGNSFSEYLSQSPDQTENKSSGSGFKIVGVR